MVRGLTVASVIGILYGVMISCAPESGVDFNSEVRPILNKKCMSCHGGVRQNGGLSFLFPEQALDTLDSGKFAIVPGSPGKSELIHRIKQTNPELRMPPEGPGLSPDEINVLTEWIRQGAHFEEHWAYVPPDPGIEVPEVENMEAVNNEIDRFVIDKLAKKGLGPSAKVEPHVLIRRVSFDLTGLPPEQELLDEYRKDPSPQAFEKVIDQLLASPHFGERWAAFWLDLARYADSQGYQKDNLRPTMWMYRDWVIDAFNQDMPFDQFTMEQLAGDLLPNATNNQLLATAFHRNTMNNDEGGTDDEEFRVAAVLDRVNTTFEVWQGTTMSCVQCHTHPYDPIKHQEYYGLYAYFNNTWDSDKTSDEPNAWLLSQPQKLRKQELEQQLEKLKAQNDTISRQYREVLEKYISIRPVKVPVMRELPADSSRTSHVFVRGNWLVHGEQVQPAVPEALNQSISGNPANRLELAHWLVDTNNPLTARVMVNRFWEQLFGRGLVETLEDFGSQSTPPTYPRLLDWLALQYMHQHRWQLKPLLKQIVLSATYQQASRVTPELLEIDPYNRFLARGPRVRLSAEQIRDQALAVSGKLNTHIYGPSVMPPQPEGVWNVIRHRARWETSEDPEYQNRRALYTFWRRVSPYPSMMTFDATSREFCVSRRIRTNTPLQAFVTLNDPVFFDATRALASKMRNNSESVEEQIKYGFQKTLYRSPTDQELHTMKSLFDRTLQLYREKPLEVSAVTRGTGYQTAEMAATISMAAVILNLDQVITKG